MGNSKNSHKLTREENEKAVELAIGGKDPIGYLKECGCKNPWASWAYIKNVLKKSKPELYAKLPSDDDRLDEEVSYGAQAAPAADPPVPADDPEAADPLDGFEAVPVNQQKAPEADLTIKAEDLQAAEDPAVARMEQIATMEPKPEDPRDRAKRILDDLFRFPENVTTEQNPAGRVVLDKNGVHLEPPKESKKPDWEKTTFFGIPCEVTALKIDDFEFAKDREGMRAVLPGGTILWGSTVSTPAIMAAEQWKRLAEIIPKVMKILQIE